MSIKPRRLTNEEISIQKKRSSGIIKSNLGQWIILLIIAIPIILTMALWFWFRFSPLICLIFLGGVIWFIIVKAKSIMKDSVDSNASLYNQSADVAASTLDNLLTHVDYYNTYFFGGIAVDVKSRRVAIVTVDAFKTNNISKVAFDIENIKDYKFQECDSSAVRANAEYLIAMSDVHTSYGVRGLAVENIFECKSKNGLAFHLDDIKNMRAFIALPTPCAEEWMTIIEKLINGTLEQHSEPVFIPYGKSPEDFF